MTKVQGPMTKEFPMPNGARRAPGSLAPIGERAGVRGRRAFAPMHPPAW